MKIADGLRPLAAGLLPFSPFFLNKVKIKPVMAFGCARSGTQAFSRLLRSHPDFKSILFDSTPIWFPKDFPWERTDRSKPPFWIDGRKFTELSLVGLSVKEITKIKSEFISYGVFSRKKYLFTKCCMAQFMLPFLHKLFPEVKFIHIYRDGRDVSFSLARKTYRKIKKNPEIYESLNLAYPLEELFEICARSWNEHIFEIEALKKEALLVEGANFLEVRYEDICLDQKREIMRICDFLQVQDRISLSLSRIEMKNQNGKYLKELSLEKIKSITTIMEPVLRLKGYL